MRSLTLLKLLGCTWLICHCSGCCCWPHHKGITLRGGLDFREYKKPSGFVELVDTEWDERRRMNDLRWLENADCYDEMPAVGTPSPTGTTVPGPVLNDNLPTLDDAPQFTPPPAPEDVPPAPPPQPEQEPASKSQDYSAQLPPDYDDQDDYQQMIELTGYERAVRSVANRPSVVARPPSNNGRQLDRGSWLWAKP